ncbi:MAG: WD40-repeat containing protein, partial [Planctomycetaceae bacterium]|nr:WD40-repeat containing protein [Planctomycetaceae bacterium]
AWLMNGKQCAALTRALKDPESHISVWERGSSKTIRRFGEKLRCADFSWDGTRVLTGGAGGQVTLWEVNTGQAVQSFSGHTQWIAGLALSQCGTRAVSISPDRTARIWKLPYPSNTEQIFEDADSEIESVTFSPNLDKLSFAAKNGGLFYHPRSSGRVAGEATGQSSISVVAWASDSQQSLFATGVSDSLKNEIVVNRSHATFRRLRGHRDRITAALFSVDSRRVISGSLDGTIRIWDTQKEAEIAQLNPGVGVLSLAVDPMGRPLCVSSGNEDFARIWDLEKRQEQLQLRGHSMIIKSVAFSRDGNRVITGSADSTIRIWETETGKHIHTLSGHTGSVNSVAVSRDGSFLVSGGDDRTVRQWDLSTGECVNVLEGHSQPVNCVAISHRQVFAASGSDDHTVRLWRISPVSPASKSRPAAESLDLLKGLDLAKAVMEGSWVRDATGLLSPTDAAGTIEVFGSGPSEYELTCDVERLSGDGPLSLGIVMQGQQGCIFLDAKDGMLGGLAVKKKSLRTTGVDSWNGTLLAPGRTHQISCQIRADQVTVHVDGRTIVDWTGQPASLMIPEGFHAPQQLALALATADKTRFRVSAIKLGQVADQSGFALKPSDSVAASLQRARTAQVNQSEFKNVIWDAAPALQPVPVMIDDEPFQWHHVSLATNGTGNGGIRFRSPLDKPGYLVWTFATTSGVTGWKFFTPSGTIPPSVSYHYEEQLDLPGLPLVPFNRVFLQHPASWHIRPDEECVIWFQFQDKRPVDLYCAVRLLPVGTGRTPVTRNEILQNLGLPLPLHYLDQTEPQVRRSEGNAPPIESWITAANGRWIAASEYYPWDDHPCHVRVYHSPSLEFLREIKLGQSNTVCLAGSPDSERIAVLTRDENCRIWEIKTGEQVAQFKMPVSGVNSMAFTADGQGIIACGQQLAICHARTGQILLQPAPEKQLQATALTITPNGRQAITGGADGVVVFWNLDKFEESSRMETGGAVSSLRVSPNGQLLAVNDALRPVVRVWDLRTQKQIQEFHGTETAMAGLDISQDGTRLLTGELKPRWSEETPGPELLLRRSTQDHRVRLWDIQTGKELLSIHGRRTHAPRVQFLASDAEVLTGSGDGYFRSWSLKLPQPVPPVLKGAPAHVFNDLAFPVSSLAVTADGQLALGGGGDVTAPNYPVQVWDLKDCRQIGHFDSHTSPVTGLTTDPSSDDVISASRDGAVFSWNAKTQVAETSRVHRPAQIVQYSHDGKSVLCGGETILEYRSLAALRDVWSMNFGRPGLLGLSQDGLGRQVFTCNKGDSGVRLWNVKSGRTEGVLQAHRSQVTCVAAASYGKVVVSGGDDGTVRVWDKVKRRQEHCFETESGPIHCVAVSNDGRRALSGGQDGLIRLWDLEQHFEIWQGKEHQGAIRSVAFTPDNHRALSGGIDQRVCIWDLPVPNTENQAELTEKTVADWVLGHDGLLMLHIGGIDYGNWNKSYQLPVHMSYSIRGITLTATPVTSEVVSAWARLPQLERLELQKVSISPEAVQSLCQLTNLQSLAIVNSECDPASLSRLEVLKQLHSLQLVTAQIEQSGLEALARLTSLRKLSLRIQQLKASDIRVLQALDSLDELELTGLKGGEQHWISDLRKVFPETRIWTGDESD